MIRPHQLIFLFLVGGRVTNWSDLNVDIIIIVEVGSPEGFSSDSESSLGTPNIVHDYVS